MVAEPREPREPREPGEPFLVSVVYPRGGPVARVGMGRLRESRELREPRERREPREPSDCNCAQRRLSRAAGGAKPASWGSVPPGRRRGPEEATGLLRGPEGRPAAAGPGSIGGRPPRPDRVGGGLRN